MPSSVGPRLGSRMTKSWLLSNFLTAILLYPGLSFWDSLLLLLLGIPPMRRSWLHPTDYGGRLRGQHETHEQGRAHNPPLVRLPGQEENDTESQYLRVSHNALPSCFLPGWSCTSSGADCVNLGVDSDFPLLLLHRDGSKMLILYVLLYMTLF